MKKILSMVLSLAILFSSSISFNAYAQTTDKFELRNVLTNEVTTVEFTNADKGRNLYDFISEKLNVDKSLLLINANYIYKKGMLVKDISQMKLGYMAEKCWGEGDNYDKTWLGSYDMTSEYHIYDALDMAAFKNAMINHRYTFDKKTIYLEKDIDLSDYFWMTKGEIDPDNVYFSGVFEGNNHTISGIKMRAMDFGQPSTCGLFTCINGGAIKNLNINASAIKSNINWLGLLVGVAVDSTIYNCNVYGDLDIDITNREGDSSLSDESIGGLGGTLDHCATMNCSSNVDIDVDLGIDEFPTRSMCPSSNIGIFAGTINASRRGSYNFCVLNSYSIGNIKMRNIDSVISPNVGGFCGVINDDACNIYSMATLDLGEQLIHNKGSIFGFVEFYHHDQSDIQNNAKKGKNKIENIYYIKGTNPHPSYSANDTEDKGFIEFEDKLDLLTKLNGSRQRVDEIIVEHRDVIDDSVWKDLAIECGAKDFRAQEWLSFDTINNGLPTFHFAHNYISTVVEPTYSSEGYTIKECKICGHIEKTDFVDKLVNLDNTTNNSKVDKQDNINENIKSPQTSNDFNYIACTLTTVLLALGIYATKKRLTLN